MRRCTPLLAVVLALPSPALAQAAQASGPDRAAATPSDPEVARVKRKLETATPIRDAAASAPIPDFRVSVSEKIDIWKFWGDPSEVASQVRVPGGTWHQEFQNMVTPPEFRGYGGVLTNGEKLQLAATSLAFAGAMQLIGAGVRQAKQAIDDRARRKAKEEVQRELAEFCAANPGACPATPITPP
jgi:hypothetical protein